MQNAITVNAAAEFAIQTRKTAMKEVLCKLMPLIQNHLLITIACPLQKGKKKKIANEFQIKTELLRCSSMPFVQRMDGHN